MDFEVASQIVILREDDIFWINDSLNYWSALAPDHL